MTSRLVRAAGAALMLALAPRSMVLAQTVSHEDRLKAAFVSKFAQFVEWPQAAVDGRPTVDLCVTGPDEIATELRALVQGETINGRGFTVRRVERDQDIDGCHVLFLSAHAAPALRGALEKAAQLPILTVGDDPRFLEDGGIVQLRTIGGRVRFDVNAAAAQRAGLRISSQLLQLAATVKGGGA